MDRGWPGLKSRSVHLQSSLVPPLDTSVLSTQPRRHEKGTSVWGDVEERMSRWGRPVQAMDGRNFGVQVNVRTEGHLGRDPAEAARRRAALSHLVDASVAPAALPPPRLHLP